MDKRKVLIVYNSIIISALFGTFLDLYNDIISMLHNIRYYNTSIKEVTYSYFNVTVYTVNNDTFHLYLGIPLLIAGGGILYNLLYYLIIYLKGQ